MTNIKNLVAEVLGMRQEDDDAWDITSKCDDLVICHTNHGYDKSFPNLRGTIVDTVSKKVLNQRSHVEIIESDHLLDEGQKQTLAKEFVDWYCTNIVQDEIVDVERSVKEREIVVQALEIKEHEFLYETEELIETMWKEGELSELEYLAMSTDIGLYIRRWTGRSNESMKFEAELETYFLRLIEIMTKEGDIEQATVVSSVMRKYMDAHERGTLAAEVKELYLGLVMTEKSLANKQFVNACIALQHIVSVNLQNDGKIHSYKYYPVCDGITFTVFCHNQGLYICTHRVFRNFDDEDIMKMSTFLNTELSELPLRDGEHIRFMLTDSHYIHGTRKIVDVSDAFYFENAITSEEGLEFLANSGMKKLEDMEMTKTQAKSFLTEGYTGHDGEAVYCIRDDGLRLRIHSHDYSYRYNIFARRSSANGNYTPVLIDNLMQAYFKRTQDSAERQAQIAVFCKSYAPVIPFTMSTMRDKPNSAVKPLPRSMMHNLSNLEFRIAIVLTHMFKAVHVSNRATLKSAIERFMKGRSQLASLISNNNSQISNSERVKAIKEIASRSHAIGSADYSRRIQTLVAYESPSSVNKILSLLHK